MEWLAHNPAHTITGVITQPDRPAGRGQQLRPPPMKEAALRLGLTVAQPPRIKSPEALELLRSWEPDVLVVAAYGQILPKTVLDLPRRACLNLHASLLPRHRGAAPIQAALLAGDAASGLTVMWMDEGLDTGDIAFHAELPLTRRMTAGALHDALSALGPRCLERALNELEQGRLPRHPQDPALATYAAQLCKEDGRLLWTQSARDLDRRVRAMNPWPGAFLHLPPVKGRTPVLKVHAASPLCRRRPAQPGEVLRADARGLLVSAGEGALLLRELQAEGGRRMKVADFLRGHPLPTGLLFP
jgi:methionyl-tRNA formyltransferase